MNRAGPIIAFCLCLASAALAQTPPPALGESAQGLLGAWEFSNADRDKICTATFKKDPTAVGFKVDFDANCATLFPLVRQVSGWRFPDNDNLFLVDADGQTLVEFSEVESGIYEAPTPGVGVLFLQLAESREPAKMPEQVAGAWAIARGGKPVCNLTLTTAASRDGFALTVQPGCDPAMARLNFTQWSLDRGELVLTPARGEAWRFEEGDKGEWTRVSGSAGEMTLVKQ